MPIILPDNTTAPVFFPDEKAQIVRYLDLPKFISMLKSRSLFFSRLDLMQDHFEGTLPTKNYEHRRNFLERAYQSSPEFKKLKPEEIERGIEILYDINQKVKSATCISCWNKSEYESAALWKVYSDFQKGIMLVSNTTKIIKALEQTEEKVQMSEVHYVDYKNDRIPDGNINWPIIHKHKAYNYEKEVRLIYSLPIKPGIEVDWSKEESPTGKSLPVDLSSLLEKVVISPYAEQWYIDLIKDICSKYELDKPIYKSEFAKN